MKPLVELLVLDAHGVIFNAPFASLLHKIATETGQTHVAIRHRWNIMRADFWSGRLDEAKFWSELTGSTSDDGDRWRNWLENATELGPAAPSLERWSRYVPVWLLSNHRSDWLLPRLARFGLDRYLERILVSDRLNTVKPEPASFVSLLTTQRPAKTILFIDDSLPNVEAARRLGIMAMHAHENEAWIFTVDRMLGKQSPRQWIDDEGKSFWGRPSE